MADKTAAAAPLEHTPVDDIPAIAARTRASFLSHKTRPVEFRVQQLRKLYWALHDNKELVFAACKHDLNKSDMETYMGEYTFCLNDIVFLSKNLARWAKDEKAADIPLMNKLMNPRIRKDPLGTVLVIGYVPSPRSHVRRKSRQACTFHVTREAAVNSYLPPLV